MLGLNFKKNEETGRSMLEMLGVLAIAGILSVTAISGYMVAMRRYRANEIVQTASMLSIMARSGGGGEGSCLKLSETKLEKNPGGVSVEMVAYTLSGENQGEHSFVKVQLDDDPLCTAIETIGNSVNDYSIDCDDTIVECP